MTMSDVLGPVLTVVILVGGTLYIAHGVGRAAERRGRDFRTWFALAVFLPGLAVVVLFLLPRLPTSAPSKVSGR